MNHYHFFYLALIFKLSLGLAPSEQYPNSVVLKSPDLLNLYWKHDQTEITFELHFKDSKWAMFGVLDSNFSDVIVAWLNEDNIGHFSDRFLSTKNQLTLDSETNWIPLDSFKKDNVTVFKFKRFIKVTCKSNSNQDLNIESGKIPVVFSTGNNTDPDVITQLETAEIELLKEANGPYTCPFIAPVLALNSTPSELYANSFELVPGIYKLFWNFTSTEIVAEIHCKTNGWVGFGFSPNGGMDKSDVVIGWHSNGKVNFTDRNIVGRKVNIDTKQDWILLKSSESNGINIFKFKRSITLCDPEDLIIDSGSPHVIYAYGDSDPLPGEDIRYHGVNRGTTKVNFISASDEAPSYLEPDTEILDFTINNVILPKLDTYYFCKGFRVPKTLTEKRHIYKYEFVFPKINYKNMHHALVYECRQGFDGETPKFTDGDCYTNEVKHKYCQAISIGWAVGGQEYFYYPKETGYPIGGDTDYSFFVLELHYDNPSLDLGFIDKVSLRYFATKNLKKNELGILTVGSDSSPYGISIPPKIDRFPLKTFCPNDCLRAKLPNQNLRIIASTPHTHLAGLEVSTKIVRNGKDIGYLFKNKNYDFNYQNNYILPNPVDITKDDELITECVYTSKDREKFTFGGMGTRQEMCFQFLTYYPRKRDFKACVSFPAYEDYLSLIMDLNRTENLGLNPFKPEDTGSVIEVITKVFEILDKRTISDNIREKYTKFFESTRIRHVCNLYNEKIYDQIRPNNTYVEPDPCKIQPPVKMDVKFIVETVVKFFKSIFDFLKRFF